MTTINCIGWAWIIWTLFNEGITYMTAKPYGVNHQPNPISGILSWTLSGLAVWAALS